jgi:hypothetical protein
LEGVAGTTRDTIARQEREAVTKYLSRREFLAAAVLAGNALAAHGRGRPPLRNTQKGQSAPGTGSQEPQLWLPPTKGQAPNVKFADSPDWVRNAPGWYIQSTVSAGACMLEFPLITFLSSLIKNFRDLPSLLDQAKSLGTSTIYLVEWFEGKPGAPPINYWTNKGDYTPRLDMGGEAALKEGISALHAQGGRVILYVEGFIITKDSNVGMAHGAQWSIVGPKGPLEQPYPGAWKPCPGTDGWLTYVEGVARRIGGYGADGIFFDSQGFQQGFKCRSTDHGHRPGDPEVFNNGCANLVRRARAALREGNSDAIVFTEGPKLMRLFEHTDGSLEWGIDTFVRRWLWDDQGKTDTITSSYSLDEWNQIVAIGAKLGCGSQFLKTPPGTSAQEFLGEFFKSDLPEKQVDLEHIAYHAFWGLHAWRNGGLMLGLTMPGLDDILPRYWEQMEHVPDPFKQLYANGETLRGVLEGLRPRAAAIDTALAGRKAPAPAEYVKALLTARQTLAPFVDYGGSVESVPTSFPDAAGWRFTSSKGMALTAVNVSDTPRVVNFENASGAWKDGVSGDVLAAQNSALAVPVPPHRVRLLSAEIR